jgi:hypothetical protein
VVRDGHTWHVGVRAAEGRGGGVGLASGHDTPPEAHTRVRLSVQGARGVSLGDVLSLERGLEDEGHFWKEIGGSD